MIFCAELGSNHKGKEALAFQMIREFSNAGATICKFQLGHQTNDPIRYIDHIAYKLKRWCDSYGVEFMASIWTDEALELARELEMQKYKIAHQVATSSKKYYRELTKKILGDGKETFVSGILPKEPHGKGIYVIQKYPAYPEDVKFPPQFGGHYWYGYSDHTHGIAAPLKAISLGAQFIEVHCTLDSTEESIRDNHFACTPKEFRQLVEIGSEMARI